jgi:DNA-binding CsgD family transcriptional regulator
MEQAFFSQDETIPMTQDLRRSLPLEETRFDRVPARKLNEDVAGREVLRAVLDHVQFGVTVVDQTLELVFANSAASRECSRHPVVRIDRNKLALIDRRKREELARAVVATQTGRWSLVTVGQGTDLLMLAVLPLSAGEPGSLSLVVFGLRGCSKPLAIQFYAQACKLSPAETAVLRGLNEGLAPREIARQHGVAISTVRSQIGSIREKTGAVSILDLVRTLGCLPPIMPAAACAI